MATQPQHDWIWERFRVDMAAHGFEGESKGGTASPGDLARELARLVQQVGPAAEANPACKADLVKLAKDAYACHRQGDSAGTATGVAALRRGLKDAAKGAGQPGPGPAPSAHPAGERSPTDLDTSPGVRADGSGLNTPPELGGMAGMDAAPAVVPEPGVPPGGNADSDPLLISVQGSSRPPRGTGPGRDLSTREWALAQRFSEAFKELRGLEPNNRQAASLSPPGWVPSQSDVNTIELELGAARGRATGRGNSDPTADLPGRLPSGVMPPGTQPPTSGLPPSAGGGPFVPPLVPPISGVAPTVPALPPSVRTFNSFDEFRAAANKPEPNMRYLWGSHEWQTDALGRTIRAQGGVQLKSFGRNDSGLQADIGQNTPGRQQGDIGFHLIGDGFNAPTVRLNVVPGNGVSLDSLKSLNLSAYKRFENTVRRLAEGPGADVEIKVEPVYSPGNNTRRPDTFIASFREDGGKWVETVFPNKPQ